MLHKSEETGLSKMIHKTGVSFYKRQGRITISWLMSFGMILATSSAALNAYLVREIGKGGNRNYTATDCGRLRGCDLGMHPVNMTVNGASVASHASERQRPFISACLPSLLSGM
jgi:hypothetical protein